jgi:ankyrin repeat protein
MFVQSLVCSLLVLMLPAVGDIRLADAAMEGDRAAVQSLLAQKVDVNVRQGDGSTALHWAAYRDDVEIARLLIKAGADVKAKTRIDDFTPLLLAAKNGNAAMVELLLKAGADPNTATGTGATALMLAAASGKTEAVKQLVDHGANVNAKDITNEQTALMFAAAVNSAPAIKLLAEHGADVNAVSKVLEPRHLDGKETKESWLGGLTALHLAAREGHTDAVRELIAAKADINVVAASDKTSVMTLSIINGHLDIAKLLLDHGADPNLANRGGLAPLFALIDQQWAAHTWYPPANIEQEKTNFLDLMKGLLAQGANPNSKMGPKLWFRSLHGDWVDSNGATPFWRAAQANDVAAMRILVAAGADSKIATAHGASPLQVAAGFGYQPQVSNFVPDARVSTVKYLVDELGLDVNAKDDKGYTPLHAAALMDNIELIDYLVSKGADIKARANMVLGRNDDTNADVAPGTGDTVADMANGPREWNLAYPRIIEHLVQLGSDFSNNCRASTCVQKTRPERDTKKSQ